MEEWLQGTKNGHYSVLAHNMEALLLLTLLEEGEQDAEVLLRCCPWAASTKVVAP